VPLDPKLLWLRFKVLRDPARQLRTRPCERVKAKSTLMQLLERSREQSLGVLARKSVRCLLGRKDRRSQRESEEIAVFFSCLKRKSTFLGVIDDR
jgi:hypothetical protein